MFKQPSCTFNNRSKVGKNVIIGIGSLVLHEIRSNLTVIGRPAKDINLEKKFNIKLRELLNENHKSNPITSHWGRFRLFKKLLKPVYSSLPNTFKKFIRNNF